MSGPSCGRRRDGSAKIEKQRAKDAADAVVLAPITAASNGTADAEMPTAASAHGLQKRLRVSDNWVATLEELGDFSRLHDPAIEPQAFTLLAFGNRHGKLWLEQETALGWWSGVAAIASPKASPPGGWRCRMERSRRS